MKISLCIRAVRSAPLWKFVLRCLDSEFLFVILYEISIKLVSAVDLAGQPKIGFHAIKAHFFRIMAIRQTSIRMKNWVAKNNGTLHV